MRESSVQLTRQKNPNHRFKSSRVISGILRLRVAVGSHQPISERFFQMDCIDRLENVSEHPLEGVTSGSNRPRERPLRGGTQHAVEKCSKST